MNKSRTAGFAIITAIYIAAAILGIVVFLALPDTHIFLRVLAGDVAATVFVYITGIILKNTSVYDPYWSVAPIVILTGIALYLGQLSAGVVLLLLAVWFWGVRLTLNWAYTFKDLATQDWRYDMYKARFPRIYQLVSFAGINMVPTIVVYLCLLPGIAFIQESAFNPLTVLGFVVSIAAATIQLFADIQLHRFRRENAGKRLLIREGLWRHSRHPNYLGELMMWYGVFIIMLSGASHMWPLVIGPLANTALFVFVSIPLADNRNRKMREGFNEYVNQTNSLLPFNLKGKKQLSEAE